MSTSDTASCVAGGASSQSLLTSYHGKPFVVRNNRTYLSDPSVSYPLPIDLPELHRQSLRTLLLFQLFGGPVCSPTQASKPPIRVLEVGCGSGFWSTMCNEYYARQGHSGISFTGMDIAPVGLGASSVRGKGRSSYASLSYSTSYSNANNKPESGRSKSPMNWKFVQHDMRRMPWPFSKEEFDFIMIKDLSLAMRTEMYQLVIDESIRLLQSGGTLEMWDSDHTIRMLRPHVPEMPSSPDIGYRSQEAAVNSGAYVITSNTPLSPPLNNYIVEYNAWLVKALEARSLPYVPCTIVGAMFLQEADALVGVGSLRLAVPLSELKWEREGVGGVITQDGKTYAETKDKTDDAAPNRRVITVAQNALRRTALLSVVQMIQSLEPILREVSGKSQDEWDGWTGKMMNELMNENGTHWGECLEVGAWWAQKR